MWLKSAVDHVGNQCHKFSRRFVLFVAILCRYNRSVVLVNSDVTCENLGQVFLDRGESEAPISITSITYTLGPLRLINTLIVLPNCVMIWLSACISHCVEW